MWRKAVWRKAGGKVTLRPTETSVFGQAEYERRPAPARPTVDESAEALRRRADVLLDEMMLNGVNIGFSSSFDSGFAVDVAPGKGTTRLMPTALPRTVTIAIRRRRRTRPITPPTG